MRARITWMIAGIALAVAAAAWLVLRPGAAPRARPAPGPTATSDPDATPAPVRNFPDRATPRDSRVSKTPEKPPQEVAWGAEPRDEAWAERTERELGVRLAPIGASLDVRFVVGCRTERCAVTVFTDTEYALGTVIARMEEPDGLAGIADEIVLGAAEVAEDGSYAVTVYVELPR